MVMTDKPFLFVWRLRVEFALRIVNDYEDKYVILASSLGILVDYNEHRAPLSLQSLLWLKSRVSLEIVKGLIYSLPRHKLCSAGT
jgi:hypothetical protein